MIVIFKASAKPEAKVKHEAKSEANANIKDCYGCYACQIPEPIDKLFKTENY